MSNLKRRDILKLGVLGAAAGLGFPGIIRAQPKEIVMLGLWDQTGAFADVGPLNDRGMRIEVGVLAGGHAVLSAGPRIICEVAVIETPIKSGWSPTID